LLKFKDLEEKSDLNSGLRKMVGNSVPILSIVGESNSGKTKLIEKLIPELVERGYRVGTIKHTRHRIEIDRKGSDSFRHSEAGAEAVVLSSPWRLALTKKIKNEVPMEEIAFRFLPDVDLILAEGYKKENKPKIEVFTWRERKRIPLLCYKDDKSLLAIVGDKRFNIGIPYFAPEAIVDIVNFIEDKLGMREKKKEREQVKLLVDGEEIPLKPFVQDFIAKTVQGMVSSLRGPKEGGTIELRIKGAKNKN